MIKALVTSILFFALTVNMQAQGLLKRALGKNSDNRNHSSSGLVRNNVGEIVFASQPFLNSSNGSQKRFASTDFIYARLETNGKTLNEVSKMPKADWGTIQPEWYYFYIVTVYKKSQYMGAENAYQTMFIKNINLNTTFLNFDVLPDPQMATTEMQGNNYGAISVAPLYSLIDPSHFPESGTYTIKIELYDKTNDDWGKVESPEKWPRFTGEFEFDFNTADIAKLKENEKKGNTMLKTAYVKDRDEKAAIAHVENQKYAKEKSDQEKVEQQQRIQEGAAAARKRYADSEAKKAADELATNTMPDGWKAKSQPICGGLTMDQIKKFYNAYTKGETIQKIYAGPDPGWSVAKNEYGIPKYQYTNQDIIVFFKTGTSCGYHYIFVEKTYLGGGKYGAPGLRLGDEHLLTCDKMN